MWSLQLIFFYFKSVRSTGKNRKSLLDIRSNVKILQYLLGSVASGHHSSPADCTFADSGSAGPTDKMSLLTLEHLRLSCEPLITNRTLGYSAGDVGSVGSAHQVQDAQV